MLMVLWRVWAGVRKYGNLRVVVLAQLAIRARDAAVDEMRVGLTMHNLLATNSNIC